MKVWSMLILVGMILGLVGCADSAVSRDVKPAEVQESNARRQAEIDKLDIPEEQKAAMKARIGGDQSPGASGNKTEVR